MFGRGKDKDDETAKGQEEAPGGPIDPTGTGMNREMKRMMSKREGAADRLRRPKMVHKSKRTSPRQFIHEVRLELQRVAWPTRREVLTYSVVVIVTVAFFMTIIAGIDYVTLKGTVALFARGGK